MKCPHCLNGIHSKKTEKAFGQDESAYWGLLYEKCPECGRYIIELRRTVISGGIPVHLQEMLVYPKGVARAPLSKEVTDQFADDYKEACLTLADSPKASAALSRRCLQALLREKACVKVGNLADEIREILDSKKLPSHLSEGLDAVRNIGNFAAHPTKSTHSGEIVDVEPGEAEWNLDVLEGLFDFYFVQPVLMKKRREALNKKLTDAGKPPMK